MESCCCSEESKQEVNKVVNVSTQMTGSVEPMKVNIEPGRIEFLFSPQSWPEESNQRPNVLLPLVSLSACQTWGWLLIRSSSSSSSACHSAHSSSSSSSRCDINLHWFNTESPESLRSVHSPQILCIWKAWGDSSSSRLKRSSSVNEGCLIADRWRSVQRCSAWRVRQSFTAKWDDDKKTLRRKTSKHFENKVKKKSFRKIKDLW